MAGEATADEITELRNTLAVAVSVVSDLASRHVFRTQTDFIGRMEQAFSQVEEVADFMGDDSATDEERQALTEALLELAALAVGRAVLVSAPQPAPSTQGE